jgi:uncharacterized membrane protein YccC
MQSALVIFDAQLTMCRPAPVKAAHDDRIGVVLAVVFGLVLTVFQLSLTHCLG